MSPFADVLLRDDLAFPKSLPQFKAANYARIVAADQTIRDKSTGRSHG